MPEKLHSPLTSLELIKVKQRNHSAKLSPSQTELIISFGVCMRACKIQISILVTLRKTLLIYTLNLRMNLLIKCSQFSDVY